MENNLLILNQSNDLSQVLNKAVAEKTYANAIGGNWPIENVIFLLVP